MDPLSIIVTALATGAAAGLKPKAEQAVKDAYEGIKTLIQRKYGTVDLEMLEVDPASKSRQDVVREGLEKDLAGGDAEILGPAKTLLDVIQKQAPEAAEAMGVDLEEIRGASLQIEEILSSGPGVKIKKAEIAGDIKIKGVRAGGGGKPANPMQRQSGK